MKHKSDISIGFRCFDFLMEKYGTVGNVLKSTPIKKALFIAGQTATLYRQLIGCNIWQKWVQTEIIC